MAPKMMRVAKHLRAPKILKVGSDFSGLKAAEKSLSRMGVVFNAVFSSDIAPECQKMLQKDKSDGEVIFDDVTQRTATEESYVDLYVATPPCQSFANGGNRKGTSDPRGKLIGQPVKFVSRNRPRLFVMEETGALNNAKFAAVKKGILKSLDTLGYMVHDNKLNASDFKVPQDRHRVFIVAIRKDSVVHPFAWPSPVAPKATIKAILDPMTRTDMPGRLPTTARGKEATKTAYKAVFEKHGIDARQVPVLVDVDASKRFETYGVNVAKTLTKSRGQSGGPWVSTRGRRATVNEMMRIQGFKPSELAWEKVVSKSHIGKMLGNSVPVPLIGQVLAAGLWSAGLVSKKPITDRLY